MAGNELPTKRSCGTMEVHERMLRADASYMAARARSETIAWQQEQRGGAARMGITVIPVVVHVVYRTAAQNVGDAQIHSQIAVLNRDFRMTNPDVSSLPPAFAPLAADARIEFELARTDPSGRATSGITRTRTTAGPFFDDDGVKSSSRGGADPWPADRYLNIWVCQLAELLGYAQFPGGPAATDGVVILHTAFGTTGTAAAPFDLGRTATHEIGHWLNLRHIWGDDGGGCNGDDFVADTPNAAGSNRGTPSFPRITCNNGPSGDLFMNYMDYTDDVAMFMFTAGQVARMQASLDADRPTIGHVKPGPKLKILDEPMEVDLKPVVDHAHKVRRDHLVWGLKVWEDRPSPFDIPEIPVPVDDGEIWPRPPGPGPAPGPFAGRSPFVLSTPHHSLAWREQLAGAQQAFAALEQRIGHCEQALQRHQAARANGQRGARESVQAEQLRAEYEQLLERYRQLAGA